METKKLPASQTYYQVQALLRNPQIQNALLAINSAQMPKVIKQEIQNTLASFGFNHLNPNVLNSFVQFVKTKDSSKAYLRNLIKIKTLKNEETGEEEIWIRINPYTKKVDLEKVWLQIEEFQKQLPDYTERERDWITFRRNVEIFWEYDKYKKELTKRGLKRSAEEYDIYNKFYPRIEKKYQVNSSQDIRKIISRIKKLLSTLN